MAEVPVGTVAAYSCEDADMTLQLRLLFEPKLRDLELEDLFTSVEMPLVSVLAGMEMNGVSVDTGFLRVMSGQLEQSLEKLAEDIYAFAGERFNINSPKQLGVILFEKLKLRTVRKRKTGPSTDVNVLEELAREHELPKRLLEYRQLAKLKSTYVDTLPQLVHPVTGRIHTSFNQAVTATGRLSSSDPNLQNIPIRTEAGRQIRKAFIPADTDHVILSADYSQIELRIMAHLSGDERLRQSFLDDEDVHTRTAASIFNVDPGNVTAEHRRQAKVVNFGIMYGMGPYGLAQQLEISPEKARTFIDQYFEQYPSVRDYTFSTVQRARESGYVTTLLNRRRYLPEIGSEDRRLREFAERTAINTPIQGTAADMIKVAMIRIARRLETAGLRTMMILQVHDELVFEIPRAELEKASALIRKEMEEAVALTVPVKVDIGIGQNWLEAH
jgi:DNA polymerase-1